MKLKWVDFCCPNCGKIHGPYLDKFATAITCLNCGETFQCKKYCMVKHLPTGKKTDQQKRSQDQERRAAKRDGARVQAASGAMDHAKGDIKMAGFYRKECKCTIHKSFAIKKDVLNKIAQETPVGETPVVEVEFQDAFPKKRFYIIPEWAFEEYMELKCKSKQ